ncbi:ROK family transcriptional regulator [Alkalicoccus urumqiensis]|uniref:ROK family protein n=1 Tax=Alkalicoccus urumqiensis TaxID=1548213 RepID=A0A2P6MIC0_ALKUR|nr:ROK family transcriptional regulator [Alkalicoccus urumqiensis]PRO66034.1 ROK family protein [Alkalicoccus urumqiensis]
MANYQQEVKRTNKSIILKTIREQEPISRATLAQILHLTKATVSSLVEELIQEQYCCQTGPGRSSGGRRPLMLQFNEQAGYTISCDIGVNYILTVMTDLGGGILHEEMKPFDTNDFTRTVMEIRSMIDTCMKQMKESPFGLTGLAFGVPGLVSREGEILTTPNLDWTQSNIKAIFEDQFQVPVLVENEANAGAYGEKIFGAAQYKEEFLYISAGIGIGAGAVINGSLLRGTSGFFGEVGHTTIIDNGLPCRCGSHGCWEMYASEMALRAGAQMDKDTDMDTLLSRAAESNDVEKALHDVGYYLGVGLVNLIHTFNPQKIIIGSRLARVRQYLEEPMQQVVNERTMPQLAEGCEITFSMNDQYATVLGLTAFTIESFLDKQFESALSTSG